jgi:phospholipid N-methyltransferase
MIAAVPRRYRGTLVELGAGNGALTVRLARRCPEAQILACEINPLLAADHRSSLSGARLNSQVELFRGSAAELFSEMQKKNFHSPDFVLSGVPLGNLGREQTNELIDSIHSLLNERGMYIQFQHSLLDRKKIKNRFRTLRTIPVFLNFPPAVVYYARK